MADRISARRGAANAFFVTLHTLVVTVSGALQLVLRPDAHGGERSQQTAVIAVSILGAVLCATWWALLRSYRDINRAKFTVINRMELALPARIFTEEQELLDADPVAGWRGRYAEFGTVERVIPVVFALAYTAAGVFAACQAAQ